MAFCALEPVSAQKPGVKSSEKSQNVALLKFDQLDKSPGLRYLTDALPDSLTSAVSDMKGFQPIERRRIADVLRETEWE